MKKLKQWVMTAVLAGTVCTMAAPLTKAASFHPVLTQPTSEFPFTDVPVEYKEVVSYWYRNQFIKGSGLNQFGWEQPIKRVDAALIVAQSMGFRKTGSAPEQALEFKDIPARASEAISFLQKLGIINGKTNTLFGANDAITRGEAAILFSRAYDDMLATPNETVHNFTDAAGRYKEAINRLAASGITYGKTMNKFGVHDQVTRGEFAVMMYRFNYLGYFPASHGDLPITQNGLTMKTDKETYYLSADTGITLSLTNEQPVFYEFPYGYYALEKKQQGIWSALKYRVAFPAVMDRLEPNGSITAFVSFDLFTTRITPGEYRVVQTYYPSEKSEGSIVRLAAEFKVAE